MTKEANPQLVKLSQKRRPSPTTENALLNLSQFLPTIVPLPNMRYEDGQPTISPNNYKHLNPIKNHLRRSINLSVIPLLQPERHIDQTDQRRDLDQRADHRCEGNCRIQPEHCDRDSDRQFKVVAGRGEGDGCGL